MWAYYIVKSDIPLWEYQTVLIVFSEVSPEMFMYYDYYFNKIIACREVKCNFEVLIYQIRSIMSFNTFYDKIDNYNYIINTIPLLLFMGSDISANSPIQKLQKLIMLFNCSETEIFNFVDDFVEKVFKPVSITHKVYIILHAYHNNVDQKFNPFLPTVHHKRIQIKDKFVNLISKSQTMEENTIDKKKWKGRDFKKLLTNWKNKDSFNLIAPEKMSDNQLIYFAIHP